MSIRRLYFIACLLNKHAAQAVRELQDVMCSEFGVCRSLNSPPHITLIPPFWMAIEGESTLEELLQNHEDEGAVIQTRGISHFEDRVIFVDVERNQELELLRSALYESLSAMAIKVRLRPKYYPHITLGHKIPKDKFPHAWEHFRNQRVSWTINVSGPFVLVHRDGRWHVLNSDNPPKV